MVSFDRNPEFCEAEGYEYTNDPLVRFLDGHVSG
jgi:hypothetical protein